MIAARMLLPPLRRDAAAIAPRVIVAITRLRHYAHCAISAATLPAMRHISLPMPPMPLFRRAIFRHAIFRHAYAAADIFHCFRQAMC